MSLGGAFRRLNPGDPCRAEDIALIDRIARYLHRRLGEHPNLAASDRTAVSRILWSDIHHSSPAKRVDMSQSSVRHWRAVYALSSTRALIVTTLEQGSRHAFSGSTADGSTLPQLIADLQARFGVGRIALVADRGLTSEENPALVQAGGLGHVLATRLHRDPAVAVVLEAAASEQAAVVLVGDSGSKATEVIDESRRHLRARRRRTT